MPTRFRVPNIEIDIDDAALAPLLAELVELSATRFGEPAAVLAQRITLENEIDVAAIPVAQFWPLLRALDHVRNAGATTEQTQRLRDALVAGGITYTARRLDGSGGTFHSYSGQYFEGDRLIGGPDGPVTVLRTRDDPDHPDHPDRTLLETT